MGFELDHVFVATAPGGSEIAALVSRGFAEGRTNTHPGQGTASRGIFFENAYLEFIWLVDPAEAASGAIRRTGLRERTDPGHPASPFGVGMRSPGAAVDLPPGADLPFGTWDYAPPYLQSGVVIPVGLNSERLDEPFLFFLPWSRGPAWDIPEHPNGTRAITGVSLVIPEAGGSSSPELDAFSGLEVAAVERGAEPLMQIELDGGARGDCVDLRPAVPLLVRW
ncbi:MAG: VOC family protein [Gemmatimonadota bacterium]|nr:MAG: VOC family protein [Gemmatimonadota bacterium]